MKQTAWLFVFVSLVTIPAHILHCMESSNVIVQQLVANDTDSIESLSSGEEEIGQLDEEIAELDSEFSIERKKDLDELATIERELQLEAPNSYRSVELNERRSVLLLQMQIQDDPELLTIIVQQLKQSTLNQKARDVKK